MYKRSRFLLGPLFALLLISGLSSSGQQPTPGWNSEWRNSDGSSKLALEFGGSNDTTAGAARRYQQVGWGYRVGAGYRRNRRLAALVEYNYDRFGIPKPLVTSYFPSFPYPITYVGVTHVWSLTLEPVVQYFSTARFGGYLIGGGGFYRKVTFVQPLCTQTGISCDVSAIGAAQGFSNNAGGANLGAGFAWRVYNSSNAKLFAEGRYVWVDNTPSPHNTRFPPANERSGYFPVALGVRW